MLSRQNYEDSTRIPLLLKPAQGSGYDTGRSVEQLVEEVDIYPSLLELVGLPVPSDLQGRSWVPLLSKAGAATAGKARVWSQYPHFNSGTADDTRWPLSANKTQAMGYSMRTARWRYTEWLEFDCKNIVVDPMPSCADPAKIAPQYGRIVGTELYDHEGDGSNSFGAFENENLALRNDHADVVAELHSQLTSNWVPPEV